MTPARPSVTTDDLLNACLRVAGAFTLAGMREAEAAKPYPGSCLEQDRRDTPTWASPWPEPNTDFENPDAEAEYYAAHPSRPTPAERMSFYLGMDNGTDTETQEG